MTEKITIGLICGGTSGEHEVSLISAYNIQAALNREKYNVLLTVSYTHLTLPTIYSV